MTTFRFPLQLHGQGYELLLFSGSHFSVCLLRSADKPAYTLGNRFIQQLLTCHAPRWLADEYTGITQTKLQYHRQYWPLVNSLPGSERIRPLWGERCAV